MALARADAVVRPALVFLASEGSRSLRSSAIISFCAASMKPSHGVSTNRPAISRNPVIFPEPPEFLSVSGAPVMTDELLARLHASPKHQPLPPLAADRTHSA